MEVFGQPPERRRLKQKLQKSGCLYRSRQPLLMPTPWAGSFIDAQNFNPPVGPPAFGRVIGGDGAGFAVTHGD